MLDVYGVIRLTLLVPHVLRPAIMTGPSVLLIVRLNVETILFLPCTWGWIRSALTFTRGRFGRIAVELVPG